MTDIDTRLDLGVLEALEFEPGCEGTNHPNGWYGHVPEMPAAWLVSGPCGIDWFVCHGWAERAISRASLGGFVHNACGANHDFNQCRFIPIGTP